MKNKEAEPTHEHNTFEICYRKLKVDCVHRPNYIRYNCCKGKNGRIWNRKKGKNLYVTLPTNINFKHSKTCQRINPYVFWRLMVHNKYWKDHDFFWVWFGLIKNEEENEKYLFE